MAWLKSMSCGAVWNVVMRALKIAGAATAAVIVVLALLLIIGIPSGFLTSEIQARVERETGYRLTISGGTKIGLWPKLNVTLTDVTLENPKDPETSNRLTVGRVQADLTLASVWSGQPQITELVIGRPVLYHPLLRERTRVPSPPARPTTSSSERDSNALAIDRVTVTDGTLVAFNLRDRGENRITGINADATIEDRKIKVTGSARTGEHPLKFEVKATAPPPPVERQTMPVELALAGGVLRGGFPMRGAYGGQVSGHPMVDASRGEPIYALTSDLVGVRALPLLQSAADFDKLDGKLQAKIGVRSNGNSQRAIMSNLGGTVVANFQDGAIRGLNVARMIRSLTSGTLSGWQETKEEATDLSQLSASFRIERGQATTNDLNLIGPLVKMTGTGTIDLATKSLALRVEPKLVMTTEGQGRAGDPVGLGIPVVIDGPWSEPRIYPEMAGILDNPDAAYAKLKEMGKGLFAQGGGLSSALGGLGGSGGTGSGDSGQSGQLGKLGGTLGKLLQQGFGQGGNRSRSLTQPSSPAPAAPSPPAQSDPGDEQPQDSQAMNEVLRQLFNR